VSIPSEMTVVGDFLAKTLEVKHGVPVLYGLKSEKVAKSDTGSESKTYEDGVWSLTNYFLLMCPEILRHYDRSA
jgi:hypothetical protein